MKVWLKCEDDTYVAANAVTRVSAGERHTMGLALPGEKAFHGKTITIDANGTSTVMVAIADPTDPNGTIIELLACIEHWQQSNVADFRDGIVGMTVEITTDADGNNPKLAAVPLYATKSALP